MPLLYPFMFQTPECGRHGPPAGTLPGSAVQSHLSSIPYAMAVREFVPKSVVAAIMVALQTQSRFRVPLQHKS